MPQIARIKIDELDLRVTNFVKALEGVDEKKRQELLDYFKETLTDVNTDDSLKCRYVVQKLVDNDCRHCVRSLLRRAKKL